MRAARHLAIAALMIAALWWLLRLAARTGLAPALAGAVPDQWAHAWLMSFGVPALLAYTGLIATYPRWVRASPAAGPLVAAVLSAFGLALGFAFAGLVAGLGTYATAAWMLAGAWLAGWVALLNILLRAEAPGTVESVIAGLLGLGGVCAVAAALALSRLDGTLLHVANRAVLQVCWVPLAFAVATRHLETTRGRGTAGLVAFMLGTVAQQYVAFAGHFAALWTPSLALALVATATLLGSRVATHVVPDARRLWGAYALLTVGLWLQAVQDVGYAVTGAWLLGRAPMHALAIGCIAGLAIATIRQARHCERGSPAPVGRAPAAAVMLFVASAVVRCGVEWLPDGTESASLLVTSALLFALAVTCAALSLRARGRERAPAMLPSPAEAQLTFVNALRRSRQ